MATDDGRPIPASIGWRHSMSHLLVALLILAQGVGSSSAFVLRRRPAAPVQQIPTARQWERSSRTTTRPSDRISLRLFPDRFRIASSKSSPAPPRRQKRLMMALSSFRAMLRHVLVQIPAKIRELSVRFKRSALILALAICLLSSFGMSASAVGAGRAGGSFGPAASSSSSSRSYSSSSWSTARPKMSSSYNRLPPQIRVYSRSSSYSPPIVIIQRDRFKAKHRPTVYTTVDKKRKEDQDQVAVALSSSFASPDVATTFSVGDIVLLTGAGSLFTYGFYNNFHVGNDGRNRPNSSALGPGATVARLVVVLLNQRPGGRTVLDDIRDMSERADTSTRKGVQQLVTAVALELLRREASIGSAFTQSAHFPTTSQADREFQRQSIRNRAKFDNESFSKFGTEPTHRLAPSATEASAPAGLAVVSMHISILGDSTQLPAVRDRTDALLALNRLAADAKIDDCLMAAEILWAPDDRDEVITMDDLVADYPELVAL